MGKAEDTHRADDLEALETILRSGACDEWETKKFADMHNALTERGQVQLSERQRDWVRPRLEALGGIYGDPAKRNANVAPGKPVETPEVLKHLPKKPPRKIVREGDR